MTGPARRRGCASLAPLAGAARPSATSQASLAARHVKASRESSHLTARFRENPQRRPFATCDDRCTKADNKMSKET